LTGIINASAPAVQLTHWTSKLGGNLKLSRFPMPIFLNVDATVLENAHYRELHRSTSAKSPAARAGSAQ